MGISVHIIALATGFLLDKLLGDPLWLPHPVVWFGRAVAFCDKKSNKGSKQILRGALVTILLVLFVFAFFFFLIRYAYSFNLYVGLAIESFFVFYGIAGTTLIREGKAVFKKLEESLDAGRKQVSRIVGRDTSELSHNQVGAATLETMAENLNDGVISPLFWYAIAGIPGLMTYKMINTLDSMIGYKNEKYLKFGKFAARLDDATNYIPARLTALLMVVASGSLRAARFVVKYGKAHSSPNAGYPEAALAGILDVRFGGTYSYFGKKVDKPFIGENHRSFTVRDLLLAVRVNRIAESLMMILLTFLLYKHICPVFYNINIIV